MTSPKPSVAPPSGAMPDPSAKVIITREALLEGSLIARLRASRPEESWRSDEVLAETLDQALASHPVDEDLYLFGYGSLMWNPAFHYAEAPTAEVQGWVRRFCLWLRGGRGSPEAPGLMLALDASDEAGCGCAGIAFRIRAAEVRHELWLVWQREMGTGAYEARWIDGRVDGRPQRLLTFVANRAHARYVGHLSLQETAQAIARARGDLGSCHSYFRSTAATQASLENDDPSIQQLARALDDLR